MFIEIYDCNKEVINGGKPKVKLVDKNTVICDSFTPKKGWEESENIPMHFTEENTSTSKLKYGCTRCVNNKCVYIMPFSIGSVSEI